MKNPNKNLPCWKTNIHVESYYCNCLKTVKKINTLPELMFINQLLKWCLRLASWQGNKQIFWYIWNTQTGVLIFTHAIIASCLKKNTTQRFTCLWEIATTATTVWTIGHPTSGHRKEHLKHSSFSWDTQIPDFAKVRKIPISNNWLDQEKKSNQTTKLTKSNLESIKTTHSEQLAYVSMPCSYLKLKQDSCIVSLWYPSCMSACSLL
jgi:hypothetical protein